MESHEDLLIELLESFEYPVIRQGSLGDDPYPARFFTFWNPTSEYISHYDNEPLTNAERYEVNFYAMDPLDTYTILDQARLLLQQNGFRSSGTGHDVGSDEKTHTGRGLDVIYYTVELTESKYPNLVNEYADEYADQLGRELVVDPSRGNEN